MNTEITLTLTSNQFDELLFAMECAIGYYKERVLMCDGLNTEPYTQQVEKFIALQEQIVISVEVE